MARLALVTLQSGELIVKGGCDIDEVVGLFGSPEQQLFDLVRQIALLDQVRIG